MAEKKWDVVLDIVAPKNRKVRYRPLGITLRGEARMEQASGRKVNGAFTRVGGVIPGQRMMVSLKDRHIKIIDRMTLPENKQKDRALRELTRTESYARFAYGEYEQDQDHSIPESDWPTCLWHLRRLVDTGRVRVVQGEVPHPNDILRMCDHKRGIVVQLGDSGNVVPKDVNRPFYQMDERDLPDENDNKPAKAGVAK